MLAVGMMRPGAKIESYRLLAEALCGLDTPEWNLAVIGDGPGRAEVEDMFGFARERIHFAGALPREEVGAWMRAADVFVWPGVREAIGIVYLEAQAAGLPVAAFATAGVPIVVADSESGLLAPESDVAGLRDRILRLLGSRELRETMGAAGRARVQRHHGISAASETLRATLAPLIAGTGAQSRGTAS